MPRPPAVARLEGAGRLEPVRAGVRFVPSSAAQPSEDGSVGPLALAEGRLGAGVQRMGPFELGVGIDAEGDAASLDLRLRNAAEETVHVESVLLGFRWTGVGRDAFRFLRHGWQSWSETGGRAVDEAGDAPFPSGAWLRGIHHALGAPPEDRAGWHESALVSVAGPAEGGAACLLGVLERGEGTGLVYWRRDGEGLRGEVEVQLEVPLAAGETRALETVRVALGADPSRLLEHYANLLGDVAGARTASPFQAGWCSWYHFFHDVTEADLLRNLERLAAARQELPVEVVQLDDGYQRAVGDWLETNERFPRGLAPVAAAIRDAGFRPGIWTAPFCVVPESRVLREHPEWCLRRGEGLHPGLVHPVWSAQKAVHVLDPTQEAVRGHLMRTFAALVGLGFTYLKLDFLYVVAMQARAADPAVPRATRLVRGLDAVRAGAGEEAFLLGCGGPLGAAVGRVDGMRVGPDVAPAWEPEEVPARGLEAMVPSTRNAVRNVLARAWMHRRLWLNDPDCLMARTRDTGLSREETGTLAAAVAVTGGMAVVSDDLDVLEEEDRLRLRETFALAREVDDGGTRGTARAVGLLDAEIPPAVVARTPWGGALLARVNAEEGPAELAIDPAAAGLAPADAERPPVPLLGSTAPRVDEDGTLRVRLGPHASALWRVRGDPPLAVFCDYDGTFAHPDVGSTLAQRFAGERRAALWPRLERGELRPWDYNLELLDGLPLPEGELDAFLRTVEVDPGAERLVAWCEAHGLPFRVLSDGFDRNLDRLQELHGLRFPYDANRLWYEGGRWRIAAGAPDPSCSCGTGVCKRARIRRFRAFHPRALTVHVGNGRVSDLCAAWAADVVFAKDSLAEELESRGVRFEPFANLHDVVEGLERLLERLLERRAAARAAAEEG